MTKAWKLTFSQRFEKNFARLERAEQKRIIDFFEARVLIHPEPRKLAKPLTGNLAGYWSFRIGVYRVITDILADQLTIVAVEVGHRRDVYD